MNDEDDPCWLLVVALVCVALILAVLLAWAHVRDETGMAQVDTVATTSTSTTVTPVSIDDRGWPADWPSRHQIGLMALGVHLDHAESSMAVEQSPDGEIVVTNPPEAPIEVLPEGELEALICSYDWHCGEWIGRIRCESTMNPRAVGSAGERGLTQIHPIHRQRIERLGFTWDDMFDPVANLTVAYDIYSEQGARPWSCR